VKIQNRGARFALTCLVLIWGVAMGSPAWPAPPSNKPGGGPPGQAGGGQAPAGDTAAPSGSSVGGEAFGVFVKGAVDGVKVRVPKTPHVVLPPDGGMASDEVLDISIPATLESHTLPVITTGAIGSSKASAQSSATVENLNILSGLVTAQLVVSISSSSADGSAFRSLAVPPTGQRRPATLRDRPCWVLALTASPWGMSHLPRTPRSTSPASVR